MADEVELVADDKGVAIIGEKSAVEQFLESRGLLAVTQPFKLENLSTLLDSGAEVAQAASKIAENTGRYLKLTKESAKQVRELGLMPTKIEGVSHAMLGNPGKINKWLQIEDGSSALLNNPALLSGAAGIMTQLARQEEARELKEFLVRIDEKLDDVRRRQRDTVLAKMDRVSFVIEEAMTIREHGGDRETAWVKVVAESGTIAEVQGDALRALEALADRVQSKSSVGKLAKTTKEIENEVGVWLAVLARCFQLKGEYEILELDHVLDTAPSTLEGHRLGLVHASQDRRDKIVKKTRHLIARMDEAGGIAEANILLHVRASQAVVDSINNVGDSVEEFQQPLGIEFERDSLHRRRWRDAVRDPQQLKNASLEAGQTALKGAAAVGGVALVALASVAVSKNSSSNES